ncbi:bifunctional DNA primase/polymerase-like protein [Lentzea atacamensis]|uniref:Bifunctional DNA primase/polymerase-like protein n=2 Tax=Lentzea atacamensis TaxID=531938 RepID=A0ABX9DZ66_9PSEU|nr:bifunctional DNA primase/polymerase-like protein [Lentzea atacamensis]
MGVALAAALAGLHVFPLWPRSKTPCLHGKRRCQGTGVCAQGHLGWEQRATTDPDLIRYWWSASPTSNVGIACGPSNLYVLDLDDAHGEQAPPEWAGARHGSDVLARLAELAGQPYPDDTYTVVSPSPSTHLYFAVDEDCPLRNTAGRAGWRIDSRGAGGFVVAAGSMRRDGLYTVARRAPIAPLPQWVVPLFTPPSRPEPELIVFGDVRPLADARRQAYLDTVAGKVANALPGTAHNTLVSAAYTLGRLVGGGEFTDDEARSALHIAAQQRRVPALEADAAISDGLEAGRRSPRRLEDRAA